jgi:C4-type Zn-finger protein
MGHAMLVRYKHEGDKLLKITYKPYIGICPKCGDGGLKSPRETTKRLDGEIVQRYTCNACKYSGTGDKFDLPRAKAIPLSVETIEGIGTCPRCNAQNVSFPDGSQSHYASTIDKVVVYKQMKCRECGYKGRYKMFGVKE